MAARKAQRAGGWLLGLFALPFAAVGVGMLLLSVLPTLYDWARMQWWQPVPATLVAARLETSRSSKSSSYTVKASYRYQVAGREYQGNRVAISSGGDNVGDFQVALGARLEQALRDGAPVQVWVSPSDPTESVIDRSLRPGLLALKMVFVVVFGGVGVGLLVHVLRPTRAAQGSAGSRAQSLAAGMPGRVERSTCTSRPTPTPPNTTTNTIFRASRPGRRLRSMTDSDGSDGLTHTWTGAPSRNACSSRAPSAS